MTRKRKQEEKDRKLGITTTVDKNTTSFGSDSIKNVIQEKPVVNNNPIITPNLPISSTKTIKGLQLGKKKKQDNQETKKIEEQLQKQPVQ